MDTNTTYETGASSHSVNDLILFADNSEGLAHIRDLCYKEMLVAPEKANDLFKAFVIVVRDSYIKTFPNFDDHQHVAPATVKSGTRKGQFTDEQQSDFINLYIAGFSDWKADHGYNTADSSAS